MLKKPTLEGRLSHVIGYRCTTPKNPQPGHHVHVCAVQKSPSVLFQPAAHKKNLHIISLPNFCLTPSATPTTPDLTPPYQGIFQALSVASPIQTYTHTPYIRSVDDL